MLKLIMCRVKLKMDCLRVMAHWYLAMKMYTVENFITVNKRKRTRNKNRNNNNN